MKLGLMTTGFNDKRAFDDFMPKRRAKLDRGVWTSRQVSSAREKH